MQGLMGDIEVVASGRATPSQIGRFLDNVKKAHKLRLRLPKPLSDFYNSLNEKDYQVLRTHGDFGQPIAVSAKAGEETLRKLSEKENLDLKREADKVYQEWQQAIRRETISPGERVNQIAKMVEDSTNQAIRDRLEKQAGKIFLIDFRSPENVFKKLGIHQEVYTPLKRGQELATKELETGYQKLNQWFKELGGSAESSVKVFDWLDGNKNIPLTDRELKVANEVKDYLAWWADRLGLPENRRIRDYIAHIFEPDLAGGKRVIPEELARILDYTRPKEVFNPFLEERTGATGYKRDMFAALDAYIRRGARKLYLDKPVETASSYADLEGTQAQRYLDRYLKNLMGRPDTLERWVDENIISALPENIKQALGARPFARFVSAVRGEVYRGTLGLNVGSAIKNLTQNVNTLAELGPRRTIGGMVDLARNGIQELIDNQVLNDIIIADYQQKRLRPFVHGLDSKLFFFFDLAEKINRGVAYYGTKAEGLAKGMPEKEAIDFAKAVVRKTQFAYGKVDMPLALQSSLGKLGFQFASYPIKQAELLGGYARNKEVAKLIRYIAATFGLTAAIGDLLGMDLGEFYNIFPTLGPVPQIGLNIWGATKGDWRAKGELGKAPLLFIPGGLQARKTYEAAQMLKKGYSETPSGRKRFEAPKTVSGQIKSLLFGQWASPEAEKYLIEKGYKSSSFLPFGLGTRLMPTPAEIARKEKAEAQKRKREYLKRY